MTRAGESESAVRLLSRLWTALDFTFTLDLRDDSQSFQSARAGGKEAGGRARGETVSAGRRRLVAVTLPGTESGTGVSFLLFLPPSLPPGSVLFPLAGGVDYAPLAVIDAVQVRTKAKEEKWGEGGGRSVFNEP